MEKYGVQTDPTLVKTGGTEKQCPACGSAVEVHGSVTKCTQCGTKPFEGGAADGEEEKE
jgi:hypothetical protein